jgi:arginine decarboxylase
VFPIKVNQLREVVEEILDAGRPYHFGIEVGSKPEIYAGLSVHTDNESLIVCNGYKDDAFIRAAHDRPQARQEGDPHRREALGGARDHPHREGDERRAVIGLRVRLVTKGAGKWATSGGEHAKFGLSTSEILAATDILREAGMSQSFKLIHFHIGSQVPDILIVKRAVREAARYYAKLRKMGHPIEYLDVGGGLAIDYDGSRSTFHSSMNYSVDEYARDVVYNITDVCDDERVPHPDIVSESGRAIVAHHSVLVVEAFGSIEKVPTNPTPVSSEQHKLTRDLEHIKENVTAQNVGETWHDLLQVKEEAQKMFERRRARSRR